MNNTNAALQSDLLSGARSLPADGKIRLVSGFEAVHVPGNRIYAEYVAVRNGDNAIRSIRATRNGRQAWLRPDLVTWSGVRNSSRVTP